MVSPSSSPKRESEAFQNEDSQCETCSICTQDIQNYIPKYSSGLLWNPACSDCDETSNETDENEELTDGDESKDDIISIVCKPESCAVCQGPGGDYIFELGKSFK